eukprot:2741981-Pleurochrysis_carterae.AAC.2
MSRRRVVASGRSQRQRPACSTWRRRCDESLCPHRSSTRSPIVTPDLRRPGRGGGRERAVRRKTRARARTRPERTPKRLNSR